MWDDAGRQLFKSERYSTCITAAAWRPGGQFFAVGTHNKVMLCDAAGAAAAQHEHSSGGVQALAWSMDGMACAAACGSGAVLLCNLLGLSQQSGNVQVSIAVVRSGMCFRAHSSGALPACRTTYAFQAQQASCHPPLHASAPQPGRFGDQATPAIARLVDPRQSTCSCR